MRIGAAGGDSGFLNHSDKSLGFTHANGSESVALAETNVQRHNFMSPDWHQIQSKQEGDSHNSVDLKSQTSSSYQEEKEIRVRGFGGDSREGIYADGTSFGGSIPPRDDSSNYFRSTLYRAEEPLATKGNGFSEGLPNITAGISGVASEVGPEEPATNLLRNESEPGFSQRTALKLKNYLPPVSGERELSSSLGNFSSFFRQQASEPPSAGSDSVAALSGPIYSSVADTYPRRSRPSFLDSLNIGRDSPASSQPLSEKEKYKASSQFPSSHLAASSTMQEPSTACAPVEPLLTPASSSMTTDFFGSTFTGQNLFEKESERETNSRRQNEDFAALEQHIEDLTQEKFSLQRALEASKALTESLATENSSLTESYNQQASIVNQLKAEIDRLQGEIKARLVELESTKAEYMNAQLECNAADERAKLLASEVIGLEEKALRLRSNELKLERELENASAEIASNKKKLASLDKECQDLLQTIDALQEEKKLLQSKLRRASASGVSVDINKGSAKKDASTSTNDLGPDAAGFVGDSSEHASSDVQVHGDTEDLLLLQNRLASYEDFAMIIPPDQAQMIQNINSLMSEIKAEKEELMQALVAEVSTTTRLKDLNKELSQKLEIQTQRLELLTSQSMASGNTTAREPTESRIARESVAYADEGDEVVERVLGWIMKLFPGGPSKRRPSRL